MTADTLTQAIQFAVNIPDIKKHITAVEAIPNRFIIAQVGATVIDYHRKIIRILLNYREAGNPNLYKEDALIDIQGTDMTNFKILNIVAYQIEP